MTDERRQFKRLHAPVLCRPLGANLVSQDRRSVQDISLGGVRVFTDDQHKIGEHLELELFLPDGNTMTLDTMIVWIDPQPSGAAAKFEVGLRFVEVTKEDLERLGSVVKE
jgi:c-di-GMP-binding flagellar brake protein YcgR